MAERDKLIPCTKLIHQLSPRFPDLRRDGDLFWEDVLINGRSAAVQTLTFPGHHSLRRLHVILIGQQPTPSQELWDFQEYDRKILVYLGETQAPLLLAPKARFFPQGRVRICELHLGSQSPKLDSRLVGASEIDLRKSKLHGDDIFPNLEEAIESFSQLAHVLRHTVSSR